MFVATAVGGDWCMSRAGGSGLSRVVVRDPCLVRRVGCGRCRCGWLMYLQRLWTAQLKSHSLRAAA